MAKSDMGDSEEDGKKASTDNGFSCSSAKNDVKKKPSDTTLNDSSESIQVLSKTTKISTPMSILAASIIKSLVDLYEKDREVADLKYKSICDKMREMEVMDESYQMKEFDSILTMYRYMFSQYLTTNESALNLGATCNKNITMSHYDCQFEELEFIAGGGFGKVYRVRHRLDGTEYAVKKIGIRSEGLKNVISYLSEVKTFSTVNHPNIVQYKAAWLDTSGNDETYSDDEDLEEFVSLVETTTRNYQERLSQEYVFNKTLTSNSSLDKPKEDSSDFEIVFEKSVSRLETQCNTSSSYLGKKTRRSKRTSVSEGGLALCHLNQKEIDEIRRQQKRQETWATLYIQMELCQSTLKQWLAQRNSTGQPIDPMKALLPVKIVQDSVVQEILEQLLQGLQYIHSRGIVHHDIKTSNIFIRRDNEKFLVQLGDFGLACPLQSARHTLAFGTKLYAAPEQLAGECNKKSDMYSLGIVLFELVETFTTEMERNKYVEALKKTGELPPRVVMQHPKFAGIIKRLVAKSPEDRPTAGGLLMEISDSYNSQIHGIKNKLVEKENQIAEQKNKLAEKENQLAEQQNLLAEKDKQLAEQNEEILRLKQLLISAGVTNDMN